MKNDLFCTANKRILWLSRICDGSIHDRKTVDEQPLNLPTEITIWQNTGFLGHKPVNAMVMMPTKKSEGRQLSDVPKEKTGKYPAFTFLLYMPSIKPKNVVLPKSISDTTSLVLTI